MPATDGGTEHWEMSIVSALLFFCVEKFWSIRDFVGCYCWSFHFIGLTYTNIVYHYIHVYYICFVPKSWVFHGIQGHTPGAAHGPGQPLSPAPFGHVSRLNLFMSWGGARPTPTEWLGPPLVPPLSVSSCSYMCLPSSLWIVASG